MSVTPLPSGRFSARLPRSTGGRSETFDTEAEAHDWLAAMREALAAMRQPNGTLRSWGETVLERRQTAGLASARGDASRWAHILDGDLADMALAAIKPRHVADFARDLAAREARRPAPGGGHRPTGKTISRQTQVHVLNLLRVVLAEVSNTFGERHNYLVHHPDLTPIQPRDELTGALTRVVDRSLVDLTEHVFCVGKV